MSSKIFVNLPVADLPKSRGFFKALGFTFKEQFCDDTAACVVISDHIFTMLLTKAKFREFTSKTICDKMCGDQFEKGLANLAVVVGTGAKP